MTTTLEPTDLGDAVFRAAVDNSLDGVLVTVTDGRILYANPAACAILGADEAEILRRGRQGFSDADDPRWRDALDERRRSGRVRAVLPMVRADGGRFLAELSSRVFEATDGSVRNVVVFRDVTDRIRVEARLRAADEITKALLAGSGTAPVLTMITRHARSLMDAEEAAVFVPGAEPGTVTVAAAAGPGMTPMVARTYPSGSLAAQVMTSGCSRLIENLTAVARSGDGRSLGLGPAMAAPIMSDTRAFGVVLVAAGPGRAPYKDDDLAVVEAFAHAAGVALALDDARSEVELQHRRTVAQLDRALESRVVIEQAKGFIAAVRGIGADEAFEQIRRYARSHSIKAQDVAREVMSRELLP